MFHLLELRGGSFCAQFRALSSPSRCPCPASGAAIAHTYAPSSRNATIWPRASQLWAANGFSVTSTASTTQLPTNSPGTASRTPLRLAPPHYDPYNDYVTYFWGQSCRNASWAKYMIRYKKFGGFFCNPLFSFQNTRLKSENLAQCPKLGKLCLHVPKSKQNRSTDSNFNKSAHLPPNQHNCSIGNIAVIRKIDTSKRPHDQRHKYHLKKHLKSI